MRITLESTVSQPEHSKKVIIEIPYDDFTMDAIMDDLIIDTLLGYGYQWANIQDYFNSMYDNGSRPCVQESDKFTEDEQENKK